MKNNIDSRKLNWKVEFIQKTNDKAADIVLHISNRGQYNINFLEQCNSVHLLRILGQSVAHSQQAPGHQCQHQQSYG